MNFLELVTIVVDDYDRAIHFSVELLGFELVEDSLALTNRGHSKAMGRGTPSARTDGHRAGPC